MRYRFSEKTSSRPAATVSLAKSHGTGGWSFAGKKGVVYKHYHCKKFVYQPLKRIPRRKPQAEQFDAKDFSL